MADNLIQKSHKTSEKNKYNNVVHRTTSESLRLNESEKGVTHPTSLQAAHNPRKISSFQITSVTVGSRVSTDAGEDSADDLDESHTDDISRVTDIENETPSYSEDTFSKDDVFYNASSASLGCAPVIPTSSQYGLAIVGQDNATNQIGGAVPNSNNTEVSDMHVSVTNAGAGSIINLIGNAKPQEGMKEIQEHVRNERFKVVKIESTEPFRRGRWMCMDYLDHTTQQIAPITINNNLDVSETNTLQAPDSGVVINDSQHDEMSNDLTNKGPKDMQGNAPTVQQLEQTLQKQFPMASPGQSLTQPLNAVQQQMQPVTQSVSVQSPPLEMPQQMPNQNLQANQQQVGQQHPQSMTHITMQNAPQNHPQQTQQQQVQQIPQSFPQHQLQQVIAQSQGMAMQQIPMHQQMPQQMQQIPNQQMQQISQHMPQAQIPNMPQMQQQMPQMQAMPNQGQITQVAPQQPQMQQMQMQQIQGQPNPQMHMQQTQIANMGQTHHMQGQQPMGAQQAQLQHLPSQAQIQALQNQQIPNHIQQMQMPTQLTGANQQMPQMQTQMHQLPSQPQQSVVPGMHPQMQQQGMSGVQQQYNQAVSQQSNAQSMITATMPSSQQQMVQPQHTVPQYHTQQSQMSQQGQTLPQEVLTSIVTSQQGATLPSNLQPMPSQPQGSTLPANLQSLTAQQQPNTVHTIAPQQGNVPQGNMMMTTAPQNMQMTLDGNQPSMIPASDPIFMQPTNVGQQMPVGQHMGQQNLLPQQVGGQAQMGGVQYVSSQPVAQVSMAHQNIPMMQPNMPVGMGGGVHPNVVQSQTSMGLSYGNVVPVMSQSSVAPVEATVSGTNSPVVSMPVSSTAYVANTAQPGHDSQGFGSPVSAVSHAISGAVMSSVNVNACDSGAPDVSADTLQAGDTGDGKEEQQPAPPPEDESINGLALALGGSGAGSPATANDSRDQTTTSSRAPSPPPNERQQHSSASGTSAVAIDNKIEQAMDLVKSHLMFAVREEVEVLKERIAELMERINQLEVENTYLRAHASQDTLAQLPAAAGTKPPAAPQGPQPPVS
ncbi:protein bunched, class 2/F/G isoform [Spodoptera frugiperda]|uniref:Protein bunched, class 2/F/G isoform n=1 Tax=Spodoptera frugiperda TaxID=7108 RepID=A0A9R0EMH3_SPOFR|nr:protein bunched, class 2/F/G isoform [Spodoptera frugiperda]